MVTFPLFLILVILCDTLGPKNKTKMSGHSLKVTFDGKGKEINFFFLHLVENVNDID